MPCIDRFRERMGAKVKTGAAHWPVDSKKLLKVEVLTLINKVRPMMIL